MLKYFFILVYFLLLSSCGDDPITFIHPHFTGEKYTLCYEDQNVTDSIKIPALKKKIPKRHANIFFYLPKGDSKKDLWVYNTRFDCHTRQDYIGNVRSGSGDRKWVCIVTPVFSQTKMHLYVSSHPYSEYPDVFVIKIVPLHPNDLYATEYASNREMEALVDRFYPTEERNLEETHITVFTKNPKDSVKVVYSLKEAVPYK